MNNIYYNYYQSPIGLILINADDDALISLTYVDDFEIPESNNKIIAETIKQLDEYFNGMRTTFELNLKIDGTKFQQSVWEQLINIEYGQLKTYQDIAREIRNKKATRAVGGACNKNKIPIIIPCHRVIGANGKMTGYAGGLNKKEWLLDHENNIKKKVKS